MNVLRKLVSQPFYQKGMFFIVLGYTFTLIPFEPISNLFRVFLVIGTLLAFISEGKNILKDPIFILLGCALVIPIFSWLNGLHVIPDQVSSGPKLDRLARIFTFFLLAYWLKGLPSRVYYLWATFIVGFFLACIISPNFITDLQHALQGQRIDFGIKNAQFTSMFAGITFLVSLFALPLIYRSHFKLMIKVVIILLFVSSLIFSIFITISSQSRQVWLAIAITLLFLPLFYALIANQKRIIIPAYIILALVGVLASQSTIVTQRATSESGTINAILSGKLIPMSSVGIRVNSWIEASSWIKQNPIIGSSSNAIDQVIQQSTSFPPLLKKEFHHLHSYYIEVLVAYGLLGLSLIIALYYWVLRSIFAYKKQSHISEKSTINNIIIFSCSLFLYWVIINFFETYNSRSYGVFAQTIIFSSTYTFYLSIRLKNIQKKKVTS